MGPLRNLWVQRRKPTAMFPQKAIRHHVEIGTGAVQATFNNAWRLSHSRIFLPSVSEYNNYYIRAHYNTKHKCRRTGTDRTLLGPREEQCTTAATEATNSHTCTKMEGEQQEVQHVPDSWCNTVKQSITLKVSWSLIKPKSRKSTGVNISGWQLMNGNTAWLRGKFETNAITEIQWYRG